MFSTHIHSEVSFSRCTYDYLDFIVSMLQKWLVFIFTHFSRIILYSRDWNIVIKKWIQMFYLKYTFIIY